MLRLHADRPSTVERGEEAVVAAEIQPRVIEVSEATSPLAMKTAPEQAPKVRIVQVSIHSSLVWYDRLQLTTCISFTVLQVNPFDVAQDMIIPSETSAVALNLSKETRYVITFVHTELYVITLW